ncbi:MAG: DivIVA domain-containing protein [Acutalibacteraceae bacterium]
MITLEEMKNINFHKAGFSGGYRTDEVDLFIDRVIEKVEKMQEDADNADRRVKELEKTSDWLKNEKDSLSNVFIKAQLAADSIEKEAKEEAEKLLNDAREEAETTLSEAKAEAQKLVSDAQEKADKILQDVTQNSTGIVEANNAKIHTQKLLYEQLQIEVAKFRADMLRIYKEHLRVLKTLPNSDVVKASIEQMNQKYPTTPSFSMPEPVEVVEKISEAAEKSEDTKTEPKEQPTIDLYSSSSTREEKNNRVSLNDKKSDTDQS